MREDENYWTKMSRRTLSRRQTLRLAALGGLAATGVLGCRSETQPRPQAAESPAASSTTVSAAASPTTSPRPSVPPPPAYSKKFPEANQLLLKHSWRDIPDRASPKPPNTGGIYYGQTYEPAHLDITKTTAAQTITNGMMYMSQLIELGAGPDADMFFPTIQPDLAEKWERPDPVTYIWNLRQGVKFHNIPPVNGRELTSEDVNFAFSVYRDPKAPQSASLSDITKTEAPSKYTFKFTTGEPVAHIMNTMASRTLLIFAREVYEAPGELMRTKPIGTGPWIYKEFTPKVKQTDVKNPDYFQKDKNGVRLPYLDGLQRSNVPDPVAREAGFRQKQFDHWGVPTQEHLKNILNAVPGLQVTVFPSAPSVGNIIVMRQDKAPWNDVRVRRAMSMAVDRQAIIDTIFSGGGAPSHPIPINQAGLYWPRTIEQQGQYYRYDPAAAKQLLTEAGYANGIKASLMISSPTSGTTNDAMLMAQANWKAIGIEVEIKPTDSNSYTAQHEGGTFPDLAHAGVVSWGYDPDLYVYFRNYSKSPGNNHHLNDLKMDDLVVKQRRTLNPTERASVLLDIEKYEYEQCYRLFLPVGFRIAVVAPYVHNVLDHFMGYIDSGVLNQLKYVWLDENAPKRPTV